MKNFLILISLFLLQISFCMPSAAMKIGLYDDFTSITIGSSHGAVIFDKSTGKQVGMLAPMKPYSLRINGGVLEILIDNTYCALSRNSVLIQPKDGFLSVKKKWYRGDFVVINKRNSFTLVNDIVLEEYIMGVVPSEMPSRWNHEAHKAQAIAARSYALANKGKRSSRGYDLKDTPEDQAYGGASSETKQTNKAVMDTKGIVLTYDKKIISAYYHASSGGATVNSGEVWNKDLPYLRAVPAFDSRLSKNGHGVGMSQNGANNLAGKGYNAYQILSYFYNNIHFGKLRPEWNL